MLRGADYVGISHPGRLPGNRPPSGAGGAGEPRSAPRDGRQGGSVRRDRLPHRPGGANSGLSGVRMPREGGVQLGTLRQPHLEGPGGPGVLGRDVALHRRTLRRQPIGVDTTPCASPTTARLGAPFLRDETALFAARGMSHAIRRWKRSQEPSERERHGPDPGHHGNVGASAPVEANVGFWDRNGIPPFDRNPQPSRGLREPLYVEPDTSHFWWMAFWVVNLGRAVAPFVAEGRG